MISIIYASGENGVIGLQGDMPWHLPNDLRYFKQQTTGHTVIMGRKTYESIGKPLPNRHNIIVTRQALDVPEEVTIVHDLAILEQLAASEEEVFVIGGGEIYSLALPYASKIYHTKIHDVFEGDTFFPDATRKGWKIQSEDYHAKDEKNKHDHTFIVYEREKEV